MRWKTFQWVGAGLGFAMSLGPATAQLPSKLSPTPSTPRGPDPLAVGKSAIQSGNYAMAKTFFTTYLADNPDDIEARSSLGDADLGLKDFAGAAKEFQAVVAVKNDAWGAHQNLALAYALMEDWPDFDKQRAVIKAARDNKAEGLRKDGDVIDVLHVGDKTYTVRAFYMLYGHYNTRYVFLHFGKDGKLSDYVQCESDDVDQVSFKEAHPKEAAAGKRSFSLDTYSIGEKGSSQSLIKFYSDGEPTYETARSDALKALGGQAASAATMTVPKQP
jgi:tetratricopeptide (TPR) repeat protein